MTILFERKNGTYNIRLNLKMGQENVHLKIDGAESFHDSQFIWWQKLREIEVQLANAADKIGEIHKRQLDEKGEIECKLQ